MKPLMLHDIGSSIDVYRNGQFVNSILVVNFDDMLDDIDGEYDERFPSFENYSRYLSVKLSPCVKSPQDITWYTLSCEDELDLNLVGERTILENNRVVIIEYVD